MIGLSAPSAVDRRACPLYNGVSSRVHSRYIRTITDLPCAGKKVELRLLTRRFVPDAAFCHRRIFAERFDDVVSAERSHRMLRPEGIVRKHALLPTQVLNAIGIDDWTLRRDHRYGTLVCDLERRRIVKLLSDRETATVAAWLTGHLGIEVVSRDRGGGYGEAVARA